MGGIRQLEIDSNLPSLYTNCNRDFSMKSIKTVINKKTAPNNKATTRRVGRVLFLLRKSINEKKKKIKAEHFISVAVGYSIYSG